MSKPKQEVNPKKFDTKFGTLLPTGGAVPPPADPKPAGKNG